MAGDVLALLGVMRRFWPVLATEVRESSPQPAWAGGVHTRPGLLPLTRSPLGLDSAVSPTQAHADLLAPPTSPSPPKVVPIT